MISDSQPDDAVSAALPETFSPAHRSLTLEPAVGESAAARRREQFRSLLESSAAMYVVLLLTGYAIIKIFQSQFSNRGDPWKSELRLGELSDYSLFWALYGRAPLYETFLGLIEAACVLLVFFRRTRPFGALLTFAVMANVTAMNVMFGIPATLNAASLVLASLVLIVLFWPLYRRWLATSSETAARSPFGRNTRRVGMVLKALLLILPCAGALAMLMTILRPLDAMRKNLYGRWRVESVEGAVPSQNDVAPMVPGSIVMFNSMNVLAVRSNELFHFGHYVEDDSSSSVELSVYRVSKTDLGQLPPPGRLEERARALADYPIGYRLKGTFDLTAEDQAVLRFSNVNERPTTVVVLLRK